MDKIFAWLFDRLMSPEVVYLHICLPCKYFDHWIGFWTQTSFIFDLLLLSLWLNLWPNLWSDHRSHLFPRTLLIRLTCDLWLNSFTWTAIHRCIPATFDCKFDLTSNFESLNLVCISAIYNFWPQIFDLWPLTFDL